MPTRCINISDQLKVLYHPTVLIPGCEIIDGTSELGHEGFVIVNNEEIGPGYFVNEVDEAVASEDGVVVMWPTDLLFSFKLGEEVPIGTEIINGCCIVNGEKICAPPPFITVETTIADEPAPAGIVLDDVAEEYKKKGFCNDWAFDMPGSDELDWLDSLNDIKMPDLQGLSLSGFTAFITKMMAKLGAILGKLQAQVDEIMDTAKFNPEDICKPDVKKTVKKLMSTVQRLMKLIPLFKRIVSTIKVIRNIMNAVKNAMRFVGLPYIPGGIIVEAMIKALNLVGLVDMMVGILVTTASRFTTIIPVLFAQLMAILAQCAAESGQKPPTNKEECEALGGTWIEQSEIDGLKNMLNDLNDASSDILGGTDSDEVCYCTVPFDSDGNVIENEIDCTSSGGVWKCISSSEMDDVGEIDLTALEIELGKQLDELSKCLTDADFNV